MKGRNETVQGGGAGAVCTGGVEESYAGTGATGGAAPPRWALWQVLDSAFPAGGFNHSLGLEAALRSGSVPTPAHLEGAVRSALANVAASQMPLTLAAYDAAARAEAAARARMGAAARGVAELSSMWEAAAGEAMRACSVAAALCACNSVALAAAAAQGKSLLRAVCAAFADSGEGSALGCAVRALRVASEADGAPAAHPAVVMGFALAAAGVTRDEAARAPLFAALRDVLAAATRLNALGPLAAAAAHARAASCAEALALEYIEVDARRKAEGLPLHERCALAAPLMDVLQGGHDEMFTKLFCS